MKKKQLQSYLIVGAIGAALLVVFHKVHATATGDQGQAYNLPGQYVYLDSSGRTVHSRPIKPLPRTPISNYSITTYRAP